MAQRGAGTKREERPGDGAPSRRLGILHVATLSCLAFAQPLLDLLGRTPEFLAIRRIDATGLGMLLGVLLVALPLPFVLLALAGDAAGRSSRRIGTALAVGLLGAPIALRIATATGALDGALAVACAIVSGALTAWLYLRHAAFRSFVTYLSPALVVVPLLFLAQPGVRRAVAPPPAATVAATSAAEAPVFVLVFDELSANAIVDDDGLVDATRFPNLAGLARRSTWYRNAWTVADTTNVSIPAILTGRFPRPGGLPILSDHPVNLFTILGSDYTIRADEPITRLCPPERNSFSPSAARPAETSGATLALDVSVVWLHLALPPAYRSKLPPISMSWEGFFGRDDGATPGARADAPRDSSALYAHAVEELTRGDRPDRFRDFLRPVGPGDRKVLYFAHVMLPHTPWEHLPSGRLYDPHGGDIPGLDGDTWGPDPGLVRLGAARYQMQVEFVDRLVGEFVATLERARLFDRALVVVVSDHGVAFRPGDQRRGYSPGNAADTIPVPLIVKAPMQKAGRVVDDPVTTLEILPTMLSLLGAAPPPGIDPAAGFVRRSGTRPALRLSTVSSGEILVDVESLAPARAASAKALRNVIGPAGDPFRSGRGGPRPELLGRRVAELPVREGPLRASLFDADSFRRHVPGKQRASALVTGALRGAGDESRELALVVSGTIVATAASVPSDPQFHEFAAMLPESVVSAPFDGVSVFRVAGGPAGEVVLERTSSGSGRRFTIERDRGGIARALVSQGVEIPLGRRLDGWVESTERRGGTLRIAGWAADVANRRLAAEVVAFHDGRQIASAATWVAKGYVAEGLGEPAYLLSGFELDVPAASVPSLERDGVQLFAISEDGHASRLGSMFLRVERSVTGEELVRSDGARRPVRAGAIEGFLEAIEPHEKGTTLRGWSADRARSTPAERIVVTLDGRVVKDDAPSHDRADVAPPGSGASRCGFLIHFDVKPDEARIAIDSGRARVFALSPGGAASELLDLTRRR